MAAAKLVRPPPELAAPKPPLNAENPDPRAAKPPDGLAAAAKPVATGFSVSAGVDSVEDLKTDGVDVPRDPKGDCSEPAKADRLDEAKADEDVVGLASSAGGFDVEVPIAPNGDTADAFANALGRGAYKKKSVAFTQSPLSTRSVTYRVTFLGIIPMPLLLGFPFSCDLSCYWGIIRTILSFGDL